jgi:hypothetical protein
MGFLSEQDVSQSREQLLKGCDVMERSLHALLAGNGRVADEVHAIRKLGKSLRGGFALFRLGKSSAKEIQTIGRLLSEPRDAVSRYNTWNKLAWDQDPEAQAAIGQLLEQQTHSAARRPPAETISWCIARVSQARKLLNDLSVEELPDRLAVGLRKLSKQLNKRCRALDTREEESFHDARKALKAYLGALAYLPEESTPQDPKMADLASLLGDENDLATLAEWLENHGFTEQFTPSLWKQLKSSRAELRKQALADAGKLLSPLE